jgi:hypothetical protein
MSICFQRGHHGISIPLLRLSPFLRFDFPSSGGRLGHAVSPGQRALYWWLGTGAASYPHYRRRVRIRQQERQTQKELKTAETLKSPYAGARPYFLLPKNMILSSNVNWNTL